MRDFGDAARAALKAAFAIGLIATDGESKTAKEG